MQALELFTVDGELDTVGFDAAEAVIERGQETFVEVGLAIMAIRDGGKAERERRGFATFEQYMLKRWGWSRQHGYQLIQAAEVVRNLSTRVDIELPADHIPGLPGKVPLPTQEKQARALAPLPPEQQREVWHEAVRTSPDGRPKVSDLNKLARSIRAEEKSERMAQPVPVPPAPPKFEYEPETTNIWSFRQCDPRFGAEHPGRIPGQIVVNLLHLYTKPGDLVLDPFAGSGTTIDVCKAMDRQCAAYDLAPRRPDVIQVDASNGRYAQHAEQVELVMLDPPYWRQKRGEYTAAETDLSNLALADFYDAMEELARQVRRTLTPTGVVALILSQARVGGVVSDLAFECSKRFGHAGLELVERICVPYFNAESQTPFWATQARDGRFLLRAYRDLMVFA